MKPASSALQALLATRQFFVADLYTFAGGNLGTDVLRYCGGDLDVTANGFAYAAGGQTGPYFDRQDNKAKCHWKIGTAVDTLVFDVVPGSATVLGAPFLTAVRQGLFDGSELTLERVYMPTYGDTRAGTVRMFVGRVAEIDAGRSIATFSVNSQLELLNLQMPRNLFQPGCVNNLGDASCTVNLASYAVTGTVEAGATSSGFPTASLSQAAGYFNLGKVVFTSGALAGLSRTVQYNAVESGYQTIGLVGYLPAAPAAGDTFTIYPGCDKTTGAGGCAKFNNLPHFRGFPYVPQPSTAV
jgi:uncharacterized phage protein (TIGR02218 family)